jgi:hypothetical protein
MQDRPLLLLFLLLSTHSLSHWKSSKTKGLAIFPSSRNLWKRALDCWRGGGLRGVAAAAVLERGREVAATALERGRGGAQQGLERRRAAGSQELERCRTVVFGRVLEFLMGLGLAWAA